MKLTAHQVAIALANQPILQGVTLNVEAGEVVGLIGPNGSGKSTLLRALYRMLRPIAGRILLGDQDLWKLTARESAQRTGVVLQESPSSFELTVQEVVQMGRTPHKGIFSLDSEADAAIVTQALRQVNMLTFAEKSYHTLSGGEKQRVLIARALSQQPKLLILDEPTNHLDIYYQIELLTLVRSLGITTLVALHDLNLAAQFCQRLYVMKAGRIVASGTTPEILTPELLAEVFQVQATCGFHPVTNQFYILYGSL
ncbi:MAG: ABC transporter ATP-binding protein [Leptolyngbyaceae cyanobacterium CRU_2_3]|nr:ABC transporter ATP-binding protein [Leptolyngbyaceae cyanobacterium CRU_2_3]